jgi:hypothetical protein
MNAAIRPEVIVPSSKKGAASMKIPRKRVLNVLRSVPGFRPEYRTASPIKRAKPIAKAACASLFPNVSLYPFRCLFSSRIHDKPISRGVYISRVYDNM